MRHWICGTLIALALTLPAPVGAQDPGLTAEDILKNKCSLCHSAHRVIKADPVQLAVLIDRMVAKNPDWFKDTDKAHLVEGLSKILRDPAIVARRKVWEETVALGKQVFSDKSLGTVGKSCADCHKAEELGRAVKDFPIFDTKLNRYINLAERFSQMIVTQMVGHDVPAGDPRLVALEAYLKSIE